MIITIFSLIVPSSFHFSRWTVYRFDFQGHRFFLICFYSTILCLLACSIERKLAGHRYSSVFFSEHSVKFFLLHSIGNMRRCTTLAVCVILVTGVVQKTIFWFPLPHTICIAYCKNLSEISPIVDLCYL